MTFKIKLVRQDHKYGCVPACLAMIRGVPYRQVEGWFDNNFDESGVKFEKSLKYLSDFGYQIVHTEIWTGNYPGFYQKEIIKPFAPVHIISFKQSFDSDNDHCVVMDHRGKLFEPSGFKELNLSAVWEIISITGIWPLDYRK